MGIDTGRYRLQESIGRGSAGSVWRAVDDVLGRPVAIKRMPREGAEHADARREARLAARVHHPNVVTVLDLVETATESWVVMELVDGEDLAARSRREGALAAPTVAALLLPIADALAHAHAQGVVHRDVKPSNILVDADGVTRLTDFGVARGEGDATATATGLVTGSPAYLAPEVAMGRRATTCSDVWSLAAAMVHLLDGRPPYHRATDTTAADDSPLAVVHRIVNEPALRPAHAGLLAPLLDAMLAREPGERPAMAEVRDRLLAMTPVGAVATDTVVLAAVPQHPPVLAHPSVLAARRARAARPRRQAVVGLAAAAAIVVAGAVGVLSLNAQDDGGPAATDASGVTGSGTSGAAQGPSAQDLADFARSYVRTADADPAAGLRLLTPEYRARSDDYADFWGPMKDPQILDVRADPAAMTVTYTYRYVLPGSGRRTETVTLALVATADGLRIADAV